MSDNEGEYVANKRPGSFYFSSVVADKGKYVSMVTAPGEEQHFIQVKNEIEIRLTTKGKQQIKAFVTTDERQIQTLSLQRFDGDARFPNEVMHFSLRGSEIDELLTLAALTRSPAMEGRNKLRIDPEDLFRVMVTPERLQQAFKVDPDLVRKAAEETITDRDIVALAYRKNALAEFERLLNDEDFFTEIKTTFSGPEAVWQDFFERNTWIFGYGLFFVFSTPLEGRKFETTVAGHTALKSGKRADALLKTRGAINALCFAEIKHHQTLLLEKTAYREEVWPPSRELVGAVAQIQKTVDAAEQEWGQKIEPGNDGAPTGEQLFFARPRSIVVAGRLSEFKNENGPNALKFRQFELYRRQVVAPEILTFDELYERAKFIVDSSLETS